MKIFKKICSAILIALVGFLIVFNILALTSRKDNKGVPMVFGESYLTVMTDSMEPTLPVGTLIHIKKIQNFADLQPQVKEGDTIVEEGDIITYYRSTDNKIVTHRLYGITSNTNGTYTLDLFGDNMYASSCPGSDCHGRSHDFINSQDVIGKYVGKSNFMGKIFTAMQNKYVSAALIFIPGGYVVISSIIDFIKQAKIVKKEEQEETEASLIANQEKEKDDIIKEARRLALEELEKEKKDKEGK